MAGNPLDRQVLLNYLVMVALLFFLKNRLDGISPEKIFIDCFACSLNSFYCPCSFMIIALWYAECN